MDHVGGKGLMFLLGLSLSGGIQVILILFVFFYIFCNKCMF